jgi:osmotically-inducible protein OsmY
MKSNELLQSEVLDELAWDPAVDSSGIGVTVRDSVVTLSGKVPNYAEKLAAERAVKRIAGVKAVVDELTIEFTPGWIMDDSTLAESAARALQGHVSVPRGAVTPFVTNGWIRLEGTVNWDYQRRAAERAVRTLPGVSGVLNLIALRHQPVHADLKKRIEAAFRRHAQLDADHVLVNVLGGTVTLSGQVSSWYERDQAEQSVWAAPGVMRVENKIEVEAPVGVHG